jgi:hypothetical protein
LHNICREPFKTQKNNMKKHLLTIASVAMIAGVVSFSSCKKDDTTAPTITVAGGNAQTVSLQGTWSNPTATAADDVDGDISASITVGGDVVNTNLAGVYNVTYTVSDAAGNTATETVAVTVQNDAAAFAGTYPVHDSVPLLPAFNYNIVVTASNTINNRIHFANAAPALEGFAYYENNNGIYAVVAGTSVNSIVTLPSQTTGQIGTDNHVHTFQGNGTVMAASPLKFSITYSDEDVTAGATATGCVMTLTHQ